MGVKQFVSLFNSNRMYGEYLACKLHVNPTRSYVCVCVGGGGALVLCCGSLCFLNKFNDMGTHMLKCFYHMTLELFCYRVLCVNGRGNLKKDFAISHRF